MLLFEIYEDLKSIEPIVLINPIYTTITAISLQSLFNMCVNSCQATASISFVSSLSISQVVNTIRESFSDRHVAKAFILLSWIIPIFGAYTVPLLVGGKDSYMLGNIIVDQVQKTRNWPLAAAFSMVITIISIAGIMLITTSNKKEAQLKTKVTKEENYIGGTK